MGKVRLLPHQQRVMDMTAAFDNIADYIDMGGGKTFIGSEQIARFGNDLNVIICQKSKIQDWVEHMKEYYPEYTTFDLTKNKEAETFYNLAEEHIPVVGVINYDLVFRRSYFAHISGFTLLLDESSMIQNETAQRSKFVLKMHPEHVILLSGTPTAGKYERLWSQLHLLGWDIGKKLYYKQYVETEFIEVDDSGFKIPVIVGYKNVDRLKRKLAAHGAVFMKTEEFGLADLPKQNDVIVNVPLTGKYREFMKNRVVWVDEKQLIGDTTLTKRLYARQLCGHYNPAKLDAFKDLIQSTEDRLIVFYNFNDELNALLKIAEQESRPVSIVNGSTKDLNNFERCNDSVTFIQYQAGAMGLNLQKANKIVYFTLPDKSELFEQSKKRIHRIGQELPCYYYYLMCKGSVETDILKTLKMRKDYTDELFRKSFE